MSSFKVIIVAIVVLVAVILLVKGRKKTAESKEPVSSKIGSFSPREQLKAIRASEKFWGIAIETREDSHACKAVRKITDQAYQTFEVPMLPLAECDSINCRCRYYGLPDLRKSERRKATVDRRESIRYEPSKDNRRSKEDRREKSELWKDSNTLDL
jgi:hypothetical protein